ncbi:MAG TPA: transporter substrate-binding domain-containing protein [Nocardioides sp.]|nr:transporter substrate-binding domain-containing protein [Nocardioides sp.]
MSARRRSAVVPLAVALLLTGCGLSIPTDPDGTLDRVRSSEELRVGASPSGGWVEVTGAEAPGGHEARLVESFAEDLGVDVAWTVAGEEHLVTMLEDGELDLAVGGFTDSNAWVDKVGLTRPYAEVDVDGSTEAHVMMVPMGENDLQSTLERWLDDHGGAP